MSKKEEPKFNDKEHAEIWRAIKGLDRKLDDVIPKLARVDERTRLLWVVLITILAAILGLYLRGGV